jgi:NADP-dependent 3-hydroxy acid dehydrogenase YdfG
MSRLEQLIQSNQLSDKRIIITGCGYKPIEHTFYDITTGKPSHDSILIDNRKKKLNIGSATAAVLASAGATIHMVSKSEDKLRKIKQALPSTINKNNIEYSAIDLLSESEVKNFVLNLPRDKPIYWIQSVGLGAGNYAIKDDNPYLPLEQIDLGLIEAETNTVIRATHLMMKELLPIMQLQKESKIAIVTSMSAIRGYAYGGTHCAAKGAIDRYANSAMLGLYSKNIFVTTVRPGAIDTGMYDNSKVQEAIMNIDKEYGGNWEKNKIRLAPPTVVGEAIKYIFTTPAHIPSINIVSKGQFPNEDS